MSPHANTPPEVPVEVSPLEPGLLGNFRHDLLAGFLVFLIAVPLCLGIAKASGFPPIAGIWTAVLGGLISCLMSNSELTIKGPAAGLIVIVLGAVTEFGAEFAQGGENPALVGYRLTLGVGVAAGLVQILFGLTRVGRIVDLFPLTPVHGLLASIGLIIIGRQAYDVLGVPDTLRTPGEPLHNLESLPWALPHLNPEIACIGLISLLILFGVPFVARGWFRRVPTQLLVLLVAIPLGLYFELDRQHTYPLYSIFTGHEETYPVNPTSVLVNMPNVLTNPTEAFVWPDLRGLATPTGLKYLFLFTLVGSLESLLSARAIELIDPWRRKTDFDRDLLAIGVANTVAALIGALPMISEIVRSKANIDNGARTRKANLFHGLFLLGFILVAPYLIHHIPVAALAAMLIYTGYRLASPREFLRTYHVGSEQFLIFVGTIVATLATNLLTGVLIGVAIKLACHLWHGAPIVSLFLAKIDVVPEGDETVRLVIKDAAVFSNWPGLRSAILEQARDYPTIVLDLSRTWLVDHSVMVNLHDLEKELAEAGTTLVRIGLEDHCPLSRHPRAARRKPVRATKTSQTVA